MLINERLKRKLILQNFTKSELLDLTEEWRSLVSKAEDLLIQSMPYVPTELKHKMIKFTEQPGVRKWFKMIKKWLASYIFKKELENVNGHLKFKIREQAEEIKNLKTRIYALINK